MSDQPRVPRWMQDQQKAILVTLLHGPAQTLLDLYLRLPLSVRWGDEYGYINRSRYTSACRSANSLAKRGLLELEWVDGGKRSALTDAGRRIAKEIDAES